MLSSFFLIWEAFWCSAQTYLLNRSGVHAAYHRLLNLVDFNLSTKPDFTNNSFATEQPPLSCYVPSSRNKSKQEQAIKIYARLKKAAELSIKLNG